MKRKAAISADAQMSELGGGQGAPEQEEEGSVWFPRRSLVLGDRGAGGQDEDGAGRRWAEKGDGAQGHWSRRL